MKKKDHYEHMSNPELKRNIRFILSLFITADEIRDAITNNLGIIGPEVIESEPDMFGEKRIVAVRVVNRCGNIVQV